MARVRYGTVLKRLKSGKIARYRVKIKGGLSEAATGIKRPGRIRRLAAREGGLDKSGKIKMSWLNRKIKTTKDPSLKRALILARTFKTKRRK